MRSEVPSASDKLVEIVAVPSLGGPLAIVALPLVFVEDQGSDAANALLARVALSLHP